MDTTRKNTAHRPGAQLVGSPLVAAKNSRPAKQFRPNGVHVIVLLIIIILAGFVVWWFYFKGQQRIMTDRYQAIHLQNGQVFFGKLQNTRGEFLTIRDPYYTPASTSSGSEATKQLSLIKVGEEVYGPERSVSIARSTIQYWENLRTDSKIVDAIKQQ